MAKKIIGRPKRAKAGAGQSVAHKPGANPKCACNCDGDIRK